MIRTIGLLDGVFHGITGIIQLDKVTDVTVLIIADLRIRISHCGRGGSFRGGTRDNLKGLINRAGIVAFTDDFRFGRSRRAGIITVIHGIIRALGENNTAISYFNRRRDGVAAVSCLGRNIRHFTICNGMRRDIEGQVFAALSRVESDVLHVNRTDTHVGIGTVSHGIIGVFR